MRTPPLSSLAMTLALAACGNDVNLPPANDENLVETVSLYALTNTAVTLPSGYELEFERAVRTDQSSDFDFAFDIPAGSGPVLLPSAPLGLGEGSGFRPESTAFDSLVFAPLDGYIRDSAVTADSGALYVVRSRPALCSFGNFAYFAKLRVLAVDTAARRVDFEILVNSNCGYRSLETGVPTR